MLPYRFDPALEDGQMVLLAGVVIIGIKPRSWAHSQALRIVRSGLAEVLDWLGMPVEVATAESQLAALRNPRNK